MPSDDRQRDSTQRAWRLYAVTTEWVIGSLGLAALGWWLDSKAGSFPWWTVGLGGGGALGGLANLIRVGLRSFKQETRLDENAERRGSSKRS
jgi:hypothetical protein